MLDALGSLVEKSLVRQSEGIGGEPRFGMLETIREFALEQSSARGGADELARDTPSCSPSWRSPRLHT